MVDLSQGTKKAFPVCLQYGSLRTLKAKILHYIAVKENLEVNLHFLSFKKISKGQVSFL